MDFLKSLTEHEDALLFLGLFTFFWLVVLPKALAPLIAKYYLKIPAPVRAVMATLLPTLESAIRNVWVNTYMAINLGARQTAGDLDDKLWEQINDLVLKEIDKIDGKIGPPNEE